MPPPHGGEHSGESKYSAAIHPSRVGDVGRLAIGKRQVAIGNEACRIDQTLADDGMGVSTSPKTSSAGM